MSLINEALKKAQQERERAEGKDTRTTARRVAPGGGVAARPPGIPGGNIPKYVAAAVIGVSAVGAVAVFAVNIFIGGSGPGEVAAQEPERAELAVSLQPAGTDAGAVGEDAPDAGGMRITYVEREAPAQALNARQREALRRPPALDPAALAAGAPPALVEEPAPDSTGVLPAADAQSALARAERALKGSGPVRRAGTESATAPAATRDFEASIGQGAQMPEQGAGAAGVPAPRREGAVASVAPPEPLPEGEAKPEPAAPVPAAEPPAPEAADAIPATVAAGLSPAERYRLEVQKVVDTLNISGLREAGERSKAIINNRVYRHGDVLDRDYGLRVAKILNSEVIFVDGRDNEYRKGTSF